MTPFSSQEQAMKDLKKAFPDCHINIDAQLNYHPPFIGEPGEDRFRYIVHIFDEDVNKVLVFEANTHVELLLEVKRICLRRSAVTEAEKLLEASNE